MSALPKREAVHRLLERVPERDLASVERTLSRLVPEPESVAVAGEAVTRQLDERQRLVVERFRQVIQSSPQLHDLRLELRRDRDLAVVWAVFHQWSWELSRLVSAAALEATADDPAVPVLFEFAALDEVEPHQAQAFLARMGESVLLV